MELLTIVENQYPLTEQDCGEFSAFSASGMDFTNRHYDAKGLGSVSTMYAEGPQGMTMSSVIINPFFVDAPLLSIDRIRAMGTDMLYLEMFDTTLDKGIDITGLEKISEEYSFLPDQEAKEQWYDDLRVGTPVLKKCTDAESGQIDALIEKYLSEYIKACTGADACDESEKKKAAAVYSEGLLENGGPATDPVVMSLGKEKTSEFFRKVLFATE